MHMSLTCIWITLLLAVVLLGIGAIFAQWLDLLQFQHGMLLGGTLELPCPMLPFLGMTGLYLLLRWSILWSRWVELRSRSNRSF